MSDSGARWAEPAGCCGQRLGPHALFHRLLLARERLRRPPPVGPRPGMASDEELVPLHGVHSFITAPLPVRPELAAPSLGGAWRPGLAGMTAAPAGGILAWVAALACLPCSARLPPRRWCVLVELLSDACGLGAAAPGWPLLWRAPALRFLHGFVSSVLFPCEFAACPASAAHVAFQGSYLVDPASSHMLVSKIKPCMSKYKLLYTVKLRMAH